jgi:hypothetical protein
MIELLEHYMYGHTPPGPFTVTSNCSTETDLTNQSGTKYGKLRSCTVYAGPSPNQTWPFSVMVYIPLGKGPFATFVSVNAWDKQPTFQPLLERNYLVAELNRRTLHPDDHLKNEWPVMSWGVQKFYPDFDWGAIAVWAWGASRTVDFLLTNEALVSRLLNEGIYLSYPSTTHTPDLHACRFLHILRPNHQSPMVDDSKLMAIGHSRAGKTVLWMAVLDERVSAVFPLMSGEGGCGAMRVISPCPHPFTTSCDKPTQDVSDMNTNFPYWFGSEGMSVNNRSGYGNFSEHEFRAPWDQHWPMMLVAPRAQIGFNGLANQHENPRGSQATYTATRVIYDWMGVPDRLGIHFHTGPHPVEDEDWPVVADFADFIQFDKKPANASQFTGEAYAIPKQFNWAAPSGRL